MRLRAGPLEHRRTAAAVGLADRAPSGVAPPVESILDLERRRGPLRPEQLLSVRERQSRRLGAHTFRVFDVAFLVLLTFLTMHAADGDIADVTLARAVPAVVGSIVAGRSLRSLHLYRFGNSDRLAQHLGRVVVCSALGLVVSLLATLALEPTSESYRLAATSAVLGAAGLCTLHCTWWSFVRRWRKQGWLTPNIVIVGATAHAEDLIREAIEDRHMNVLGIFDDRKERSPLAMLGVPVLGDTQALLSHKITPFVDLVVVAVDVAATARVRQITARLAVLPNPVCLIFDHDSANQRAAALAQMADAPLAPLNTSVDTERRAFAKRLQDLAIGIPMLIALSPVMLAAAVAVRLDSKGPVFFRQRRHGFNNEEITVWKFRTMRQEMTDARAEQQVTANDVRVTRVGRILRSTSLDEIPQLFNVLKGEMSLVGPRPHAVGMKTGDVESARLVAEYAHRHRIKPGMTGWAAIKGSRGPLHHAEDVGRRVELDVDYINRQSFWLDLQIMLLTAPSMLGDRSAIR